MARRQRRAQISKSQDHQGQFIEEIFDDNLLPDSSEIKKLSELDPDIMKWLKARAEKEQEFRHAAYSKKIKLVSNDASGLRWINYLGLFFSFVLLAGGMYLSYTLIIYGHEILGSIFTGVTLIAIASLFLNKVKNNNSK